MSNSTKMSDLITGNEGQAYITVDGQNRYFFELSKIEATIEFTVIAKKLLGQRMKQHKVVGAEGKGSMSIYNVSPSTLALYREYINTGRVLPISINIINDDASSSIGRRTVLLRNCIFAKTPVAMLDDSSEELNTVDIDFTFDDVEELESYNIPENMR